MSRIKLKKVDQISRKTVSDARDGFLRHCQLKNLAPHTYTYYKENLQFFFDSAPQVKFVDEFNQEVIENFIGQLMDKGNRVTAINARLRAAYVFLRYCFEQEYSEIIEPFGMDENWIQLPFTSDVEGIGFQTAEEIRRTVESETGLTVSVGVSFSKIFAKLGSDMKKPNAVTVIPRTEYKEKVWPLPVSDLFYVGPATTKKLALLGCRTIGDLANADPHLIHQKLGKNGLMLYQFANGTDGAQVMPSGYVVPVKSVGHGITCTRDLESNYEVWLVLLELAQDVGHRLRAHEIQVKAVQVSVRDKDLGWCQWQTPLVYPSQSPYEIACAGFDLFRLRYTWQKPVRALSIRGINPINESAPVQLDIFNDFVPRGKQKDLDNAIDDIRRRYGSHAVINACLMGDLYMANDRCETVPMPNPMYQ